MPTVTQYTNHLQLIDRIIKGKTEGFTHEDSMRQLPFPGNCMNWNLGHILVYRMQYLGLIDGVTRPDPDEFAMYGAGSDPLTDGSTAIPLETLLARLDDASAAVATALASMPQGKFAQAMDDERGGTLDDRLQFYIIFHESYHTGQLEILHELALAER